MLKKGLSGVSGKEPFSLEGGGWPGRAGGWRQGGRAAAPPERSAAAGGVAELHRNVFMLQERQAYNFPELLARLQEEVVLCGVSLL